MWMCSEKYVQKLHRRNLAYDVEEVLESDVFFAFRRPRKPG